MFESIEALQSAAAAAGGLLTAGGVNYAALAVVVAERFTTAKRETSSFTPRDAGLAYEDLRFHARGDDVRLAAWYLGARCARGAVILVRGRGASKGNELAELMGQHRADLGQRGAVQKVVVEADRHRAAQRESKHPRPDHIGASTEPLWT